MNPTQSKKERSEDIETLKEWFGDEWQDLTEEEQEKVLAKYQDLLKSRVQNPLKTIRYLHETEFNYALLIIAGFFGISLSLVADLISTYLSSYQPWYYFGVIAFFFFSSIGLITIFRNSSRRVAKHRGLLEALRSERK